MDKKQKLEKTVKDLQTALDKAQSELAEADVTYSVGDRFVCSDGRKCLLIRTEPDYALLVNLANGNRFGYNGPTEVKDTHRITQREFSKLYDCNKTFTRYWNQQKGEEI